MCWCVRTKNWAVWRERRRNEIWSEFACIESVVGGRECGWRGEWFAVYPTDPHYFQALLSLLSCALLCYINIFSNARQLWARHRLSVSNKRIQSAQNSHKAQSAPPATPHTHVSVAGSLCQASGVKAGWCFEGGESECSSSFQSSTASVYAASLCHFQTPQPRNAVPFSAHTATITMAAGHVQGMQIQITREGACVYARHSGMCCQRVKKGTQL